jgi:hypothetical protein
MPELFFSEGYEFRQWESFESPRPEAPFPFIAACLFNGMSVELASGNRSSRVILDDFDFRFNMADNGNGNMIIDVSDSAAPRYCFVNTADSDNPPTLTVGSCLRSMHLSICP